MVVLGSVTGNVSVQGRSVLIGLNLDPVDDVTRPKQGESGFSQSEELTFKAINRKHFLLLSAKYDQWSYLADSNRKRFRLMALDLIS